MVDAPTTEVMALKEGLLFFLAVSATCTGCNRFIIQSDSLEVMETMRLAGISSAAGAPIYEDCNILWQNFDAISIEHCDRE